MHSMTKVLDLKKLVEVCTTEIGAEDHKQHAELKAYKDYGLTFRFYKATEEYITLGGPENNSNKTDQQKFAGNRLSYEWSHDFKGL